MGEPVAVQFTAEKNIPLKTEANLYCRLYTVITPLLSLGAPDLAGTVIIQLTSQVDFACFIKIVLLVLKYLTVLLPTRGEERKIKFSRLPARWVEAFNGFTALERRYIYLYYEDGISDLLSWDPAHATSGEVRCAH